MKLLRCYNNSKRSGDVRRSIPVLNCLTVVIFVVVISVCVELAQCALPLRKVCGDVDCQELEYCRPVDHTCQPCEKICEQGGNFDEDRCVSDCQDYIHEHRYLSLQNSTVFELQRVVMEEKYKKLEDDVFILKVIVGVCVAVILLVVAILAAFLVYFWKLLHPEEPASPEEKMKKKGSTKSASSATTVELPTVYNNRYGVTTPTPEISPSSVISSSPADTNITTFTSIVPPAYHSHGNRAQSEASIATGVAATARSSPETVTTTLTSTASTLAGKQYSNTINNVGGSPVKSPTAVGAVASSANRFRREPSESTLPENCAYDNLSMSPQHHIHYSHHV